MRELIALAAGPEAAAAVIFDDIAEKDWVKASLEGLGLVRAGRFAVHGSHDRHRVPGNAIGIEIEAALAFGTGHHGTTRGCLLMLDGILKQRRPRRVLDVGTGTGVLAMAAARALHRPVASGDIDPVAVEAARENALNNRAGAYVRPVVARGVGHPVLAAGKPYDLVFANILARPLTPRSVDRVHRRAGWRDHFVRPHPARRSRRALGLPLRTAAPRAQDGTRRLGHPAPARWRRGWAAVLGKRLALASGQAASARCAGQAARPGGSANWLGRPAASARRTLRADRR